MNKINEQQNQINIIKRDGRVTAFDESKIQVAIQKSFIAVDGELSEFAITKSKNISSFIKEKASDNDNPLTVEEIQDLVENGLMSTKRKDVARAYIIYRNERTREREKKSNLMQNVREKIDATNIENQNANVDERSFGGRRGEAINVLMKQDALDNCMSEMARFNHVNMLIYQHDLDSYSLGMHNCLTIPFDPLFEKGFNTRQVDIRPPQSVAAACQQVAVLFQLESLQQFGGVAASHLDWTLAPYVLKTFVKKLRIGLKHIAKLTEEEIIKVIDWFNNLPYKERSITNPTLMNDYPDVYAFAYEMTETETYQAVEAMYHNLNSLQSRSGKINDCPSYWTTL